MKEIPRAEALQKLSDWERQGTTILRRGEHDAGAWMRFFVAEGAPQNDDLRDRSA
jgi:hypothetical protein